MGRSSPWQLDGDVALFAWLNFCIKWGVSYENTIVEKVAEVGEERTWCGIQRRLHRLVRSFRATDENEGNEDNGKMSVILERGTDCLQRPPRPFREKLNLALQKYEEEYLEDDTKLLSNEQFTSQPLSKQTLPDVPLSSPTEQAVSGVSYENEGSSSEEESNQRKRPRLDQGVFEDAATKKAQHDKQMTPISLGPNTTKDKQLSPHGTHSRSAITANPQKSSASSGILPITVVERMNAGNRPVSELDHGQASNGTFSLQHVRKLHAKIDLMRQQHDADRRMLYGRIDQLEQANKGLKAKNTIHQATSNEFLNAGRGPLEEKLRQKNQEIYELTEKLHQKTNIMLSVDMPPKPLQITKVDEFMQNIQYELKAMVQNSDSFTGIQIPKNLTGNLERLVIAAFASSYEELDGRTCLWNLANRHDASAVINLLAVAALNTWIFLTDFPRFGPKDSEKQELYEDIVLKSGGWDQLRWLDLTAYKARMKTTWFRDEQVREKATNLASQLSNTLSPLFSKTASEDGQSFHTWGEDEESWQERQYHYSKLFEHALKLKCNSVLTDENYSFSFFLVPCRAIPNEATPPNAWLCISFQVYKSLPSEDDKVSALVQTRNFLDLDPPNLHRLYRKVVYLTREGSHFGSQEARGRGKNHLSNDNRIVNRPPHQYDISRGSITARELSGTTATREPDTIHRKHPKQLASERHRSDISKEGPKPTIAASSQLHGEQPPRRKMIVCRKCGESYQSMSNMTPQGKEIHQLCPGCTQFEVQEILKTSAQIEQSSVFARPRGHVAGIQSRHAHTEVVLPWQAPGTVSKKIHTNDQGCVNDKVTSISHAPWVHDGQNSEEIVPLTQKSLRASPSSHMSSVIQNARNETQDFSAETDEIEPVDQINAEPTSSTDRGSSLNGAPSFIEKRILKRLILHTSPKKKKYSHSSIPSETLEGGGSEIDKMQLDGESGCIDDASPDKGPASGSEYAASENL